MRVLIALLRCLATFVVATVSATAVAMLASLAVTAWYRAHYAVVAGRNLIEDYRYVAYHTLIVLPIFLIAAIAAARMVWRWSRKFRPASPTD
jgi:hypothetical protein